MSGVFAVAVCWITTEAWEMGLHDHRTGLSFVSAFTTAWSPREARFRGIIHWSIANQGNSRATTSGNDLRIQDPVYGNSHYEYRCLPDTVDARGPKAGGR
jgi:hypothetical protein